MKFRDYQGSLKSQIKQFEKLFLSYTERGDQLKQFERDEALKTLISGIELKFIDDSHNNNLFY